MKLSRLKKNSSVSSTLPSNEKDSDDDDWVSVDDGSSKSSIIVSNKKESTVDKNNDILSQSESKFKRLKKSISQSSTKDDENSDGDIDWNDQIDVVSTQSSSISKNPTTSQNGTRATNNTPPRAKNNHAIQSPSHPSSTLKRKRLAKCKEKSTSSDSDSDSDIDWNDVSKVNSPCPSIDFSSASIRKVDSLVPGESSSSSSNSSSSSSSGTSHSILVQDIRDRLLQSVEKKRSFIDSLRPLSLLFTAHDVTSFQKQYINVSGNVINADELLIEACEKGAIKTAQLILSLTKSVNSETSVQSTKTFFASSPDITTTSTNQKIFAVNFREENNYVCLAINSLKNVTDLSAAKDIIRRHRLDMKKFGEERFNDEILFEPIKLAFQHSHYNLITLLCARSPLYVVLFLQSKVLLPAMNNKNTSTTNNASPEVNDNEATVGVDVVPEGDTVGGDDKDHMFVDEPARYPCVMFQLIQGDWSLGLSQALRSIDEQLCALTTQPSKSNQYGRAYELRTEMIRKLIRSTDSSDGSMIVHWAAEENLSVCLSRLLELDPTLITATDRQGLTPLHCSCVMGSLECVDILLQSPLHTPELTLQPEKHGWTPFLYAIYREQVPCAMRLLQRSKVDIHSSSCSSSSKMTVMSGKKSDTSTGQSLFDIYDYENALLQLRLLGSIVQLCSRGDERVRAAMETLSTVPEFRQVVNTILRSHMDKVDEELGFLLLYPSLLDIESKLLVLKKACLHLHDIIVSNSLEYEKQWRPQPIVTNKDELEVGALFPILVRRSSRNHTPKIDVKLPRQNPWRGLVDIFRRRAASKSSSDQEDATKGLLLRRRLIFTFTGADEKGHGPGVEKELFETISRCLLNEPTTSAVTSVPYGGKTFSMNSTNINKSHNNTTVAEISCTLFTALSNENKPGSSSMHEPIDLSPVVDSSPNTSTSKKPNNVSTSSFNSSSTTVLPSVSFKDHQKLQMFEIFGQLLGHLLLRSVGSDFTHDEDSVNRAACNLLSINLSEVCWKLILGKEVRLADLESSDPSMHGNLKILLDTEGVDDLTLYFTAGLAASNSNNNAKVGADSNTAVRVVELIPGGTDVLVTDKNKHKYVAAIIKTVIVSRLQRQSTAIRKGIIRVIPEAAFNLFSHTDLSVLLSGATEIDVEDWRTQTSYGDESVLNFRSNTVLKWFWTLVKTLTASERSLLLRFCTGSSKLPVGGFTYLNPPFQINFTPLPNRASHIENHRSNTSSNNGGGSNRNGHGNLKINVNFAAPLPTAATCFNLLRLPLYESEGQLRKQVMTALLYGSEGFSFV